MVILLPGSCESYISSLPGYAFGAAEHAIGFVVPGESLGFGIPSQFSFKLHGNVGKMGESSGAMPNLDRRRRLIACPDAINKVADMIVA